MEDLRQRALKERQEYEAKEERTRKAIADLAEFERIQRSKKRVRILILVALACGVLIVSFVKIKSALENRIMDSDDTNTTTQNKANRHDSDRIIAHYKVTPDNYRDLHTSPIIQRHKTAPVIVSKGENVPVTAYHMATPIAVHYKTRPVAVYHKRNTAIQSEKKNPGIVTADYANVTIGVNDFKKGVKYKFYRASGIMYFFMRFGNEKADSDAYVRFYLQNDPSKVVFNIHVNGGGFGFNGRNVSPDSMNYILIPSKDIKLNVSTSKTRI